MFLLTSLAMAIGSTLAAGVTVGFDPALAALIGAVVVIVAVENYVLIYKVIRWVYQKIPGVS